MDSTIYACHRCGVVDVKLWREYQTFRVRLTCVNCLVILDQGLHLERFREDGMYQVGSEYLGEVWSFSANWWVPAISIEDDPGIFWGYSSVPQDRIEWWRALPLLEETDDLPA